MKTSEIVKNYKSDRIDLSGCEICDFTVLKNCKYLHSMTLRTDFYRDLSFIKSFENLKILYFKNMFRRAITPDYIRFLRHWFNIPENIEIHIID
jgi:hypothetical protein